MIRPRLRRRFLAGAAALGVAVVAGCTHLQVAYLNSYDSIAFEPSGEDLLVSGTLNQFSLASFEQAIAENPETTRLVLMYVPGSVDDETNLKLGNRVRDLGLDTHLTADSEVHSGGTDLFLAGLERSMEEGAIIGVHSWAEGNRAGADFPKDDPVHESYVSYTARMLGSADFYWFTLDAAPVEDTYIMTPADIAKYGLLTKPVVKN
ncbi:alpha/beta hydrolase [Shimia sp. R9_2]|uniref:alpha/beta hydrolase n=1 Tax=Shimia sp. R9_2 TaxID=2821112 RepID=UPI001ADD4B3D|nr:alpha/beta hydrolase [Shimia sp. R9_2]MBO9396806.1 alpha/beta hydrolase [Shimia sp. R9_2]